MKKTFKKTLALLISVLMVLSSVSIGGGLTAQATTSTQTISVTNNNYYGVLRSTNGNSRYTAPTMTIVNDAKRSNFDIGFVTFNVSALKGQNINISEALYKYVIYNASWTENLGIRIYYPTKNYAEFHKSGELTTGSTDEIWTADSTSSSLVDHMGKAIDYFGMKEIEYVSPSDITTTQTERSVDISESLQWSIDNNLNNAVICFMTAKQGGIDEKNLSGGTDNGWTDTYVKITNTSLTATVSDSVALKDFTAKTTDNYGTFASDSDYNTVDNYKQIYKNVLYSPTGINSVYTTNQFDVAGDDKIYAKANFYYGNTVLMYDGTTTPQLGIGFSINGYSKPITWNYNNVRTYRCNLTNGNGMTLRDSGWHGKDGRINYTYMMFGQSIVIGTTSNQECVQGQNGYYGNVLQYTGGAFDSSTKVIDSMSFDWVTKHNGGSAQTNSATISSPKIYIVNYRKVIDNVNSARSYYNSLNKSIYEENSLNNYVKAINNLQNFDPNSYDYASDVSGQVSKAGSDIDSLISAVNTAKDNLKIQYTFINSTGANTIVYAKNDSDALANAPANTATKYQSITDSTHNEVIYTWPTTATNRVFTEKSSISYSVNHSFTNQSSSDSNKYTCECGAELDATSYNKAISSSQNIGLHNAEYTTESYQQFLAVYKECYNKISSVHSQAELDAYTSKLLAAQTYLVKVNVTVKFIKNINGTETTISESTYSYGTEQTFDSGITDANITKWTVETEDGTSSMHTSLSSVKYVPYKDATIIVYADDNSTSETNTHKVVFRGLNGSVQEVRYVESLENIGELPAGKNYSFYTFSSWGEPKTVGDTTYYDAVYTFAGQDSDKCGVHFAYKGDEVKQYEYDTYVKLSDTTEGKTYALSTSASESDIITYIKGNAFHTPHVENVYVIECDSADAKIGITGSYTTTSEKKNITVNVKYYIPDGAVRVDSGVDVVLVKGSTKSDPQRIKCPNVNNFNEFTKTLSTSNAAITAFEITPYVVYTLNGQQIEVKGSTQTYNL